MLFYLQSTDPDHYSTVKFYANPPLGKDPLLFRINQVSTIDAFMVTTRDDYMEFNVEERSSASPLRTVHHMKKKPSTKTSQSSPQQQA